MPKLAAKKAKIAHKQAKAAKPKSGPVVLFPMQVAGKFYPSTVDELNQAMAFCAQHQAKNWDESFRAPFKAIVMPHAGLRFSGMVAQTAISAVAHMADRIKRIVIMAPTHHVQFQGMATLDAHGFETPLGTVKIDTQGVAQAMEHAGVQVLPKAFEGEHSIEVELPFLAKFFPKAAVVPLIIGDASLQQMTDVITSLWGGAETLLIISSDLSHFMSQDTAKQHDAITAFAIETLQFSGLTGKHACGFRPLAGFMAVAQAKGMRATQLDMRTSGDTFGNLERVVGYGAWGFEPARTAQLPQEYRTQLLDIATRTIAHGLHKGKPPQVALNTFKFPLRSIAKTFVTLKIDGKLRGCIGSMQPMQALVQDVVANSFKAAFADPRFKPLTAAEFPHIEVSISILSQPTALTLKNEADLLAKLQPDMDGLIIRGAGKQALFLPSVWEDIHHPRDFVQALKRKAGLQHEQWPADMQAWVFTAEKF